MADGNGMRTHNTSGGETPRISMDAYNTPVALAAAICKRLREIIGIPDTIIEPSAGTGVFVRAASEAWDNVPLIVAVERNPMTSLGACGAHVIAPRHWENFDMTTIHAKPGTPLLILGNPPFSLAQEHIELALARLAQHGVGHLCFLLRASMLAGQARVAALYDGPDAIGGLRYVWHVVGRPSFTPDGKTDSAEYIVACWESGYRGPYQGGWLKWR